MFINNTNYEIDICNILNNLFGLIEKNYPLIWIKSNYEMIDVYNILNKSEIEAIKKCSYIKILNVSTPKAFKKYPDSILEKFIKDGLPRDSIKSQKVVSQYDTNNIEIEIEKRDELIIILIKIILVSSPINQHEKLDSPLILRLSYTAKLENPNIPLQINILE